MSFYFPCFLQMQLMTCVRGGKFVGRCVSLGVFILSIKFFFLFAITCDVAFFNFQLFQLYYLIIDIVGFMRSGV
jgi:hypothetical protein